MPDAEHGTSARMRSNGVAVGPFATGRPHRPRGFRASSFRRSQVLPDAARALRVAFERDQLDVREFEHVPGLAAGRGARVEHAHAVLRAEQLRGELRARVLHGDDAIVEAGNACRPASAFAGAPRVRRRLARLDVRGLAALRDRRRRSCGARSRAASAGLARCPLRECASHASGWPRFTASIHHCRIVPARDRVLAATSSSSVSRSRRKLRSTALTRPFANANSRRARDRAHRLIDDRERRVGRVRFVVDEQRERAGEHVRDMRRRRLAHELVQERIGERRDGASCDTRCPASRRAPPRGFADAMTVCSAAGNAAPARTAPTACAAPSSANASESGARCSVPRRASDGARA